MGEYILSCSSTVDLREEQLRERNIHYICFHFELAGKSYMDDLGKSIPLSDFYEAMAQGADTKTSQINVEESNGVTRDAVLLWYTYKENN